MQIYTEILKCTFKFGNYFYFCLKFLDDRYMEALTYKILIFR